MSHRTQSRLCSECFMIVVCFCASGEPLRVRTRQQDPARMTSSLDRLVGNVSQACQKRCLSTRSARRTSTAWTKRWGRTFRKRRECSDVCRVFHKWISIAYLQQGINASTCTVTALHLKQEWKSKTPKSNPNKNDVPLSSLVPFYNVGMFFRQLCTADVGHCIRSGALPHI